VRDEQAGLPLTSNSVRTVALEASLIKGVVPGLNRHIWSSPSCNPLEHFATPAGGTDLRFGARAAFHQSVVVGDHPYAGLRVGFVCRQP
jgi:hypothetical protein